MSREKKLALIDLRVVCRKGSATKAGISILHTYDYARHAISHLYSYSLPIFLSIYQRTKSLRTSRLKLLAIFRKRTLIVADKSRDRRWLLVGKNEYILTQFVRFPLMAIAPRLKFKCDCELPRVRRTYVSSRDLTTRARIYHDWLRAGEFFSTLYRTIFPR